MLAAVLGGGWGQAQAPEVQPVAVGRANLLVTGRSPKRETRLWERKPHKGPGENSCWNLSPSGVAGCRLGRSCLCQRKPGPKTARPLNLPGPVHFSIFLRLLNKVWWSLGLGRS